MEIDPCFTAIEDPIIKSFYLYVRSRPTFRIAKDPITGTPLCEWLEFSFLIKELTNKNKLVSVPVKVTRDVDSAICLAQFKNVNDFNSTAFKQFMNLSIDKKSRWACVGSTQNGVGIAVARSNITIDENDIERNIRDFQVRLGHLRAIIRNSGDLFE